MESSDDKNVESGEHKTVQARILGYVPRRIHGAGVTGTEMVPCGRRTMKNEPQSPVLLYQTSDGATRLEVRMENEPVWLSQSQMVELFQTTKQNISLHIQNLFAEGELDPTATVKEYLTVRQEGSRQVSRSVEHYNLDVIISVGYRVKSHRGTQFRIWATQRLREYIVKGFTLDDERLKRSGGGITSRNSWPASETSGRRKRESDSPLLLYQTQDGRTRIGGGNL